MEEEGGGSEVKYGGVVHGGREPWCCSRGIEEKAQARAGEEWRRGALEAVCGVSRGSSSIKRAL